MVQKNKKKSALQLQYKPVCHWCEERKTYSLKRHESSENNVLILHNMRAILLSCPKNQIRIIVDTFWVPCNKMSNTYIYIPTRLCIWFLTSDAKHLCDTIKNFSLEYRECCCLAVGVTVFITLKIVVGLNLVADWRDSKLETRCRFAAVYIKKEKKRRSQIPTGFRNWWSMFYYSARDKW